MTAEPAIDQTQASLVGGRTLEIFSGTPGVNQWLYSKLECHVRGDVLEIGSGIGNLSRLILNRATSVVFSDTETEYLETLRRTFLDDSRVVVVRFDLDAPPPEEISSRRFDTIVAVNVIEHIHNDRELVCRLAGLLKPGGRLAVYVPACPFAYGSLDHALGHYRRYSPQTLTELLRQAGLRPLAPSYVNLLGLLGWTINGRIFRRKHLSPQQLAMFEFLLPMIRLEDRIRLPIGLGLYTAAQKMSL